LLFYTDGVTEAMNEKAEPFGRERLAATALGKPNLSAQELCDHIVETVAAYQHSSVPADDMTLLALRIR
jgi:sigma-B regulation protein RsbU (phosphoserine phosphatase)